MATTQEQKSNVRRGAVRFQETIWGQVFAAGKTDSPHSRKALDDLCHAYWGPINSFLCRSNYNRHDAQDRTQAFFQYVLRKQLIGRADPGKGRFRSFLLVALKNFISNERHKENAQRRGGSTEMISLEEASEEGLYADQSNGQLSPEKLFDLQWAETILKRALERCREDYAKYGKIKFADLQPMLVGERESRYAELAARLNKTEGALRIAVQRLRQRYKNLVIEEIRETVPREDMVEDEFNHLKAVLREKGRA